MFKKIINLLDKSLEICHTRVCECVCKGATILAKNSAEKAQVNQMEPTMNAINQNISINDNANIISYNFGEMVVNKNIIHNNTFITNESESGKAVIHKFLTQLLDRDMSFCVIDDELCVMDNQYKSCLYRLIKPNMVWLDVEDVVENCDILVRGVDVNEYVPDNDAQFSLEIVVGDDVDFTSEMKYENRDAQGKFGLVMPKMGYDLFEMVLQHSTINALLDRYSYEIKGLRPRNSTSADFCFQDKDMSLRVVGIEMDADGCVWFAITDGVNDSRYRVQARYTINEDRFGNRLDENGDVIQEDDE